MQKIKNNLIIFPIITAIISLVFMGYFTYNTSTYIDKPYTDFMTNLNENSILKVTMQDNNKINIFLNDGTKYTTDNPNTPNFKEDLLLKNIEVNDATMQPLGKTVASSGFLISIIAVVFLVVSKNRAGSSMTSMELTDFSTSEEHSLSFDDVAGNTEAKESLKDIVDFLKNPEKYSKYGARMPKGVILYGSPGTGKTLLAKAVAGEAKVPFYAISGSDFVQMYVGVGAARVKNLFKKAKSHGKAVIFIDEIDAVGKARDGGKTASSGNDERDQTLNALLTEMSGFGEQEGIVVIAATNRLDILDPALLRPGRFDRHVEVALPDVKARERIIELYLNNKPHKGLNIESIAKKTSYFSGAKIENLVNEAAILAAKDSSSHIEARHIETAYSTVLAGEEKKERDHLRVEDLELTAYHEAGHALLSILKTPEDKVSKISIIPTTKGAGGYTITIPKDSSYQRLDYLKNRIMVLLAGRAAEELVYGKDKISTGAQGDIKGCTEIAISMIAEYGMGDTLGMVQLSSLGSLGASYGNTIVEECKTLINNLYSDTLELLEFNKPILEKISKQLLEKETLIDEEILELIYK